MDSQTLKASIWLFFIALNKRLIENGGSVVPDYSSPVLLNKKARLYIVLAKKMNNLDWKTKTTVLYLCQT